MQNVWKEWRDIEHHRIEYIAPIKKQIVSSRRMLHNLQNKLKMERKSDKDVNEIQILLEQFEVTIPYILV